MGDRELRVVLDNSLGFIRQTDLEERVRHHPAFARLNHVYQNSAAYLTWPTIRNQRFEHSLGTKHLAGKFFFNAVQNTDEGTLEDFYGQYKDAIKELMENPKSSFFNDCYASASNARKLLQNAIKGESPEKQPGYCDFLVPSNVPNEYRMTHYLLAQSVRLAGMFHDVGHPPFSHVCEAALRDAYKLVNSMKEEGRQLSNMAENLHAAVNDLLAGRELHSIAIHEVIGTELARMILADICKNIDQETMKSVYAIESLITLAILSNTGDFSSLHEIVAGTVDVDRMDYVKRDSINSGIGSDIQYDRILDGVRIVCSPLSLDGEKQPEIMFAFPMKALDTIELFLRKRFENYRTIIYHHNVVKSGALMHEVVMKLVKRMIESDEEPSDDLTMPHNISGLWHPLVVGSGANRDALLAYSQWNDAWLISTLTDEYTRLRDNIDSSTAEDQLLEHQLGELLFSERHYRSIIKRKVECGEFREELRRLFAEDKELIDALNELKEGVSDNADKESRYVPSDPLLDELKGFAQGLTDPNLNSVREFAIEFKTLTAVARRQKNGQEDNAQPLDYEFESAMADLVGECLEELRSEGKGVECKSILVDRNSISAGMDARVWLYDSKIEKPTSSDLKRLDKVSRLNRIMHQEIADMPAFFLFLYIDEDAMTPEFREDLMVKLAKKLHGFMRDLILKTSTVLHDRN